MTSELRPRVREPYFLPASFCATMGHAVTMHDHAEVLFGKKSGVFQYDQKLAVNLKAAQGVVCTFLPLHSWIRKLMNLSVRDRGQRPSGATHKYFYPIGCFHKSDATARQPGYRCQRLLGERRNDRRRAPDDPEGMCGGYHIHLICSCACMEFTLVAGGDRERVSAVNRILQQVHILMQAAVKITHPVFDGLKVSISDEVPNPQLKGKVCHGSRQAHPHTTVL